MTISERAVGTDQDKKFVFVVAPDNTVSYRQVELGAAVDGQRIVETGLEAGDRIVVSGLQRIRPGAVVAPQEQTALKTDQPGGERIALISSSERFATTTTPLSKFAPPVMPIAGSLPFVRLMGPQMNFSRFFCRSAGLCRRAFDPHPRRRPHRSARTSDLRISRSRAAIRVVRAVYPGANPTVIAQTVATPLEEQINGVEDMLYMSSQATSDGVLTLTVTFRLGTDPDKAQQLVQNALRRPSHGCRLKCGRLA